MTVVRRRLPWRSLVGFAIAINAAVYAYRPSSLPQLGLVLSLPVVLAAAILEAARSTGRGRERVLAIVGFLAAIPSGVFAGHGIRDFDFRHRRLARYQAIVDRIQHGDMAVSEFGTPVAVDKDLACLGLARRTTTGIVRVQFFWGSGFPGKHTAYIYTSTGISSDGAWDHWRYRPLGGNWFDASD